jgi:L-asparaginase/Glu-tRNA(Gln) amidotransferase subunit D
MSYRVTVIQTGGTIATEIDEKSEESGLRPVKFESGIKNINGTKVKFMPIMSKDSSLIRDEDRIKIGEAIAEEIRNGQNVVITHGTDTLQDTAGIMNYNLVYNPRRVVFTGALYPRGTKFFDGDRNFEDSVCFAAKGMSFSGVFTVMGGHVLDPHLWGKHLYRFHDPVIQHLQQLQERSETKKVTILIPEPFDTFALVKKGKIRQMHHKSAFYEVDGHFTIDSGADGKVKTLDIRGPLPVKNKDLDLHFYLPRPKNMTEVFTFLQSYGNLKGLLINNGGNIDSVFTKVEGLTKTIGFDEKKLLSYWKKLKPHFDSRCLLKKVFVIGDTASDLSVFVKNIKNDDFSGFVIRGWGFGHANVDDPGSQEFFKVCEENEIPVVVTTGEGVPVSDEYEVARRLFYKYGCIPSGTLSDKEAQIRLSSCVGHPEKKEFIEKVAEEFVLKPLNIVRAYYVGGLLFKNTTQRLRFEQQFNVPTNIDVASSPLFVFEEKILLLAMILSYLREKVY